jgi:hypothetical protein
MNLTKFFEKQQAEKTTLVAGRQPITDKGTDHDYINGYYNDLFTPFKNTVFNLLEIGIQEGYSMDLWRGFFTKAELHAIDLTWQSTVDRVNQFENSNAYLCNGFDEYALKLFKDEYFDFIIEDGPHTVPTQIFAAQFWTKKLKPGGILIIEDIQHPETDCELIINSVRNELNLSTRVIDLRANKGRYDDVIVEITKH